VGRGLNMGSRLHTFLGSGHLCFHSGNLTYSAPQKLPFTHCRHFLIVAPNEHFLPGNRRFLDGSHRNHQFDSLTCVSNIVFTPANFPSTKLCEPWCGHPCPFDRGPVFGGVVREYDSYRHWPPGPLSGIGDCNLGQNLVNTWLSAWQNPGRIPCFSGG
jgi:hypothetical protein